MKILYHHRTRCEDAQGIHIREMVSAFKRIGCEVRVVGLINANGGDEHRSSSGLISNLTACMPAWMYELSEIAYNAYAFGRLWKAIRKNRPDMIYERYALFTFAGVFISKAYKIPIMLEVNAPLSFEKAEYGKLCFKRLARFSERWICSNAFRTITVTTPLKQILADSGTPPEKIVVIPNGIDYNLFSKGISGLDVRKRYGMENRTVLGFVGWFRRWHGLDELLQSYWKNQMAEKGLSIMLVGDGPAMNELTEFCQKNGIGKDQVIFTGAIARENIPEYIAAFDICLQPDVTSYASPIKLFEYMAMGKAIVAPAKENIIEILGPDYPGLFRETDFGHMAEKIMALTASPEKIKEMAGRVDEIMKNKRYSWERNAKKTIDLIA